MRRWILLFLAGELVMLRVKGMALQKAAYSHAGLCPNDVNPNLWVDAMSTCTRECDTDQVSLFVALLKPATKSFPFRTASMYRTFGTINHPKKQCLKYKRF